METWNHSAIPVFLRLKLLVPKIVGLCLTYQSIVALKGSNFNWARYSESCFHWLCSREISHYKIRICIYIFTSFVIRKFPGKMGLMQNRWASHALYDSMGFWPCLIVCAVPEALNVVLKTYISMSTYLRDIGTKELIFICLLREQMQFVFQKSGSKSSSR